MSGRSFRLIPNPPVGRPWFVRLMSYPAPPHAFERIHAKAPVARAYLDRSLAWLQRRLVPTIDVVNAAEV